MCVHNVCFPGDGVVFFRLSKEFRAAQRLKTCVTSECDEGGTVVQILLGGEWGNDLTNPDVGVRGK